MATQPRRLLASLQRVIAFVEAIQLMQPFQVLIHCPALAHYNNLKVNELEIIQPELQSNGRLTHRKELILFPNGVAMRQ